MLTEVKYNPKATIPYTVSKKGTHGWIVLDAFKDESTAINLAKRISEQPDIPCLIARYDNGERLPDGIS